MRKIINAGFVLVVAFSAGGSSSASEGVSSIPSQLVKFAEENDKICRVAVPQFVSDPNFEVALKERPLDVDTVCACSRQLILSDEQLIKQFSVPDEVLVQRLRTTTLKSYILLRATQTGFYCISQELGKTIAGMKIE